VSPLECLDVLYGARAKVLAEVPHHVEQSEGERDQDHRGQVDEEGNEIEAEVVGDDDVAEHRHAAAECREEDERKEERDW